MHVRGSLSPEKLTTFLEERRIPLRLGCRTPSGHPWLLSLWYRLHPSGPAAGGDWTLQCATAADATVVTYLSDDPEVAFEVSTNRIPYAGVRGRGRATVEPDPEKETLRDLLERYLGGTDADLARNLLREERSEVTITIEPVVVYGWDFSERMADVRSDER